MKIKGIIFALTFFLIILVSITAVIIKDTSHQKGEIKIGVIASLTGLGAYAGEQQLKGIRMAINDINMNKGIGDVKVVIHIEDSQSDGKGAISAAKKLVEIEGVKYIIGDSWNSTTAALIPYTNEKNILTISPVTSLDSLDSNDYFFRTVPRSQDMMDVLAKYTIKTMGIRRVAIIRVDTPYNVENARDFSNSFTKYGGVVVADEKFPQTITDYRSYLLNIKEVKPEAVLNLHAPGPIYGTVMQQAEEIGLHTRWLGHMATENRDFLKEYEKLAEGLVYPYPYDGLTVTAKSFSTTMVQHYKQQPDFIIANAYDATMLIADAIKSAKNNTDSAKQYLLSINNYPGVSGTFSFDPNGNVKKRISIKTVKDGKFIVVE